MTYVTARWPAHLGETSDAMESTVRARAQSLLTEAGNPGPLLPYHQALDVVQWHERRAMHRPSSVLGFFRRNKE